MFADLKQMAELIPTGNKVLTHAPSHWGVRTMRSLIKSRSERDRTDLPLLSVARERGVFVRAAGDDNHNVIPDDLTNYKLARKGDLVINKMKAWQGSLGLAPEDGIVSPAYYVYDFAIENRYFGQALLRSKPYVALLGAASDGVRIGQWDLSVPRFREIPVLIPPADEQAAIVKYLGHAHARIDRATAVKRKLIALLDEQKRAVIDQAVTRGLDPSVPVKDSGIPWLGEIPAHWRTERAKHVLREVDERSTSGEEEQLSVSHLTGVSPRKDTVTMFRAESYVGHKVCRPDDLVVNTMWAWMGALGVARNAGIVSPSYGVYRLKQNVEMRPDFLDLMLRAPHFVSYFKSESTGIRSSRLRLYPDQILATPLPIPPISEQGDIVDHLDTLGKELDRIRVKALAEIELLREFRTRLTSDVVTGQVDIREIAAALPELTDDVRASADNEFDVDDELIESEVEFAGANG